MSDLLIAFGVHRETGDYIEPEEAKSGSACDCLCPGCEAPLIARHSHTGDKRSHFAHDSRHKDEFPLEECPLNGPLSVAMMIRHIAHRANGQEIHLPALNFNQTYVCCQTEDSVVVTYPSHPEIESIEAFKILNGTDPDLLITVSGVQIGIELKYNGRNSKHHRHSERELESVLFLDCDNFDFEFWKRPSGKSFAHSALEFLLGEEGKTWFCHFRTDTQRAKAATQHQKDCSGPSTAPEPESQLSIPPKAMMRSGTAKPKPLRKCRDCNHEWRVSPRYPAMCPICKGLNVF